MAKSNKVWVADISYADGFSAAKPRPLFEQDFWSSYPIRYWDLAPDGRSFLMIESKEPKLKPVTEMTLVLNWFEELKRLIPTGK